MNPFDYKYVVVDLPGVPVKNLWLRRAQSACEWRQACHVDGSRRLPRCESERFVRGEWIKHRAVRPRGGQHTVEAHGKGVSKGGTKYVIFSLRREFAPRPE